MVGIVLYCGLRPGRAGERGGVRRPRSVEPLAPLPPEGGDPEEAAPHRQASGADRWRVRGDGGEPSRQPASGRGRVGPNENVNAFVGETPVVGL